MLVYSAGEALICHRVKPVAFEIFPGIVCGGDCPLGCTAVLKSSKNVQCLIQVSQEECTRLRESVPYVKLYRYNPKHLYPKLNDYGDNGRRKVWASGVSTYCTPSVTPYSYIAHARQKDIVMQWPWRMLYSTVALTSQDKSQLQPAWSTWKPKDKYDSIASVFVVQFNGFMSLTSYCDVKYRY